ncbi:MAG TPA: helix-turn-helix transcriptional regulator [Pseudonocardiaceae bacterium]|nr:helix-turn-helix transcriptional regulator [Pseudonocardiaceae bacterium]
MDHSSAIAAVLLSPRGCAVLAAGTPGKVVRLVRQALGWTQQDLADRSGYCQSTISRIECGLTRAERDTDVLADLAQVLDIPPTVLGLADPLEQSPILNGVDRRDVLGGAVALAVTVLLPQGVAAAGRIDEDDVAQCWTALRRLHELDAHQGGATVYQVAEGMAQRMQDALRHGSYQPAVGRELQRVTAVTMEQTGWLAHDAGWAGCARHWWLETCHLADMADVPEARVRALASMSLQAGERPGGGPEAVELAQTAITVAKDGATPMLLSLLAAREAIGHAQAGEHSAATSAIAQARRQLDQGRRSDEPFWLGFYGPADLAWHETQVGVLTRKGKLAETAARAALAEVDAASFPRNHTLYGARLGSVLTRLGQLDEAISVTSAAVASAPAVRGSGRPISDLRHTVDLLEKQNYRPAHTFATAARRLLPAPA